MVVNRRRDSWSCLEPWRRKSKKKCFCCKQTFSTIEVMKFDSFTEDRIRIFCYLKMLVTIRTQFNWTRRHCAGESEQIPIILPIEFDLFNANNIIKIICQGNWRFQLYETKFAAFAAANFMLTVVVWHDRYDSILNFGIVVFFFQIWKIVDEDIV